ncbi:MAG: glycosyltransferase family 2 protein [Nitrospira sp.]
MLKSQDPQPLVSVLTPVYNGEEYLAECIESVLAQTYRNWEYVIVNNRSTDRTLVIAEQYAEKDKRIRIHNNSEFVGCDQNGNIAFRQIAPESKYCKMVHADDWLFAECIEQMVELAEAHPTVAIVGAYGLRNEWVSWDGIPHGTTVMTGREICRNTFLGGPYVFGSPTSTLICCDEVRKRPVFYNEANRHCDVEICFDILRDRDFGFVHQVLTFTREHIQAESTFSKRFGTDYIATLEHLTKYGRNYLSDEELDQCFRIRWKKYYEFLGGKLLHGVDSGFWQFQRNELGRLGYQLNYGEVAKPVVTELIDLVLNPLKTYRRVAAKLSRKN